MLQWVCVGTVIKQTGEKTLDIKEVITIIECYNETPIEIVSTNIRRLLKPHKVEFIANGLNVSNVTVYSWTKSKRTMKPSFEIILRLCDFIKADISEIWQLADEPSKNVKTPLCTACGINQANAAKGLCWTCYRKVGNVELLPKIVTNKNGTEVNYNVAIFFMDDEIAERIRLKNPDISEQALFAAYEQEHINVYGEEWGFSKVKPEW
jgi:DNA-binding XRE family transcriptional regulator